MSIIGNGNILGNGNIKSTSISGGGTITINKFSYTGADQTFTIPSNATAVTIQCWGAGGATQGHGAISIYTTAYGGGGGFTQATLKSSNAGQILKIIVGEGGKTFNSGANAPATYGGGGGQNLGDGNWGSASGGGRSAVQISSNDIVTAGGGGGGGCNQMSSTNYKYGSGGSGGGLIGGNADNTSGSNPGGSGGTQIAGGTVGTVNAGSAGTNGSLYTGGASQYGAGGGGGYYGGGPGGITSGWLFGGGGGGSSFVNTSYATSQYMLQGNAGTVAGSTYLPSGVSNIGNGAPETDAVNGGANGKDGYIVIAVTTP